MTIRFSEHRSPCTDVFLRQIHEASMTVFGRASSSQIAWRLARMPEASCFCATIESTTNAEMKIVGFKIGYALSQDRYYSWLGGVDPDYRRQGIAAELMRRQHDWAVRQGFLTIETASDQDNIAMARVNLSHGFSVVGIRTRTDRTQLLYSKTLGNV